MAARMLEDVLFYELKGGHADLGSDDAVLEWALTYRVLWSVLVGARRVRHCQAVPSRPRSLTRRLTPA